MIIPLTGALEAVLFAAGSDGLSIDELARILEIPRTTVQELLAVLDHAMKSEGRGIQLRTHGDKWVLCTREEYAPYLSKLANDHTPAQLSHAAMEVLAIIAYRQPVSRITIDHIRGVQSDSAIATLLHRRLITEVGREDAPGRPILYGTTDTFLRAFGLSSLDDLPPLKEDEAAPSELSLFQLRPTLPRD